MEYYGEDDYDYHRRRRSPGGYDDARRRQYLSPGGGGLYRTRSTGHAPQPVINNIYMDQYSDAHMRNESPYRTPPPPPAPPAPAVPAAAGAVPGAMPMPYPVEPERRSRSRGRFGDDLIEDFAEMAMRERISSRSRGRTEGSLKDRADFAQWQLEEKERQIEEEKKRQLWEKEAQLKRLQDDTKRAKAEQEAEEQRKRLLAEYDEKRRKEAEKAKEEERRILDKIDREKRQAKEEEQRILEKIEREKRQAKAEEQRVLDKIERERREAKEKEEREYQEFLRKQKEKEEKEKAAKKAEKEKFDVEMRSRLRKFGYTEDQIDVMVDEEQAKKAKEDRKNGRSPARSSQLVPFQSSRAPVFAKVHRDYLSIDTLIYYDIPYEYDKTDPNYIIILREMTKYETEVLFEHTRRLRSGKLLLEAPKEKPQYAWYRKRDRSSSRVRKVGILEYKKII